MPISRPDVVRWLPMMDIFSRAGHIVLLGDSVFDNGAYISAGPDVATQLRLALPARYKVTLLARDGAVAADLPHQIARLPDDASHLVVSVGGNDALCHRACSTNLLAQWLRLWKDLHGSAKRSGLITAMASFPSYALGCLSALAQSTIHAFPTHCDSAPLKSRCPSSTISSRALRRCTVSDFSTCACCSIKMMTTQTR